MTNANTTNTILDIIHHLGKAHLAQIAQQLPEKRSRQWINTLLNQLVQQGALVKSQMGKFTYFTTPQNISLLGFSFTKTFPNQQLEEDKVFSQIKDDFSPLKHLPENVSSILYYAFTEMLNNAIEHSKSPNITVIFEYVNDSISFQVKDQGIGIFRNISNAKQLKSELEAIQELLKGKTTTLPHSHSGEGIFFTSKIADLFILDSFNHRLRIDNILPDVFVEPIPGPHGTNVQFTLNIHSSKHLDNIFGKYQTGPNSYAFDKTKIHVKLFTAGTIYISRSQARRLLANLERFKTIVLDFQGIKTIGQAFADEIFRVFPSQHPNIKIETTNASEIVDFMIKRTMTST